MDDARLKEPEGGRYFEELLARIRDIMSKRCGWSKYIVVVPVQIS